MYRLVTYLGCYHPQRHDFLNSITCFWDYTVHGRIHILAKWTLSPTPCTNFQVMQAPKLIFGVDIFHYDYVILKYLVKFFSWVMALSSWWLIFDTVFRVLSAENWASQSHSAARSSRLAASTSLGILRSLQPLHSAPYSVTHNGQNKLLQSGDF